MFFCVWVKPYNCLHTTMARCSHRPSCAARTLPPSTSTVARSHPLLPHQPHHSVTYCRHRPDFSPGSVLCHSPNLPPCGPFHWPIASWGASAPKLDLSTSIRRRSSSSLVDTKLIGLCSSSSPPPSILTLFHPPHFRYAYEVSLHRTTQWTLVCRYFYRNVFGR